MKDLRSVYWSIFLLSLFHEILSSSHDIKISKDWKEPDVWGRAESKYIKKESDTVDGSGTAQQVDCNCPATQECSIEEEPQTDKFSVIFYTKLLNLLFNKKLFNFDEFANTYTRELHLTVTADQMNLLIKSKDLRDWDASISEIFKKDKKINLTQWTEKDSFLMKIFPWLKDTSTKLMLMAEVSFPIFAIAFILAIIFFNKKYNYGIIVTFLYLCLICGYIYTYYECNKNMEIEELATGLYAGTKDPCKNMKIESKKWSLFNLFSNKNTKEQCIEYLKEKNKYKPLFCRPDDVFLIYINEMILNQFQRIIEKLTTILNKSLGMPFPYNFVAMGIFVIILPLFIKIIFAHLIDPRVWRQPVIASVTSNSQQEKQTESVPNLNDQLLNKLILDKIESNHKLTEAKIMNLERHISGVQVLENTGEVKNPTSVISGEEPGEVTSIKYKESPEENTVELSNLKKDLINNKI